MNTLDFLTRKYCICCGEEEEKLLIALSWDKILGQYYRIGSTKYLVGNDEEKAKGYMNKRSRSHIKGPDRCTFSYGDLWVCISCLYTPLGNETVNLHGLDMPMPMPIDLKIIIWNYHVLPRCKCAALSGSAQDNLHLQWRIKVEKD
jgi:hypothetical protein